jgi:hypothetical protein
MNQYIELPIKIICSKCKVNSFTYTGYPHTTKEIPNLTIEAKATARRNGWACSTDRAIAEKNICPSCLFDKTKG